MSDIVRPRALAFSRSIAIRYCGSSSSPLGRTPASRGSFAARPRSSLRACISAAWPSPPLSMSSKSNPVALPSSSAAGGAKPMAIASCLPAKRWMTQAEEAGRRPRAMPGPREGCRGEGGGENERDEQGQNHRGNNRNGELPVDDPARAAEKSHRHEHRREHERNADQRTRDLI